MKYLIYVMSFLFVITFAGCDNAKNTKVDAKATKEAAIVEKDNCKDHKACKSKCENKKECKDGKSCKHKCENKKECKEGKSCEHKCDKDKCKKGKQCKSKRECDKSKNAVIEHKCGEGKCGAGKCGGNNAKEKIMEETDN